MTPSLVREPVGDELLSRYRATYGIPDDVELTEDMVRHHWDLERKLTRELLSSSSEERWAVSERCYSTLYTELPWLNEAPGEAPADLYRDWLDYVGPPPKDVFEVGSGAGALARFLADSGHRVRATEVTSERGSWQDAERPGLTWNRTDGVHLDRFESLSAYDVVISNQVIEHLHPSDLDIHLRTARAVLRPGGRYVFSTPHAYRGPADVSAVFRRSRPEGMHLKEYTYEELCRHLRRAGFATVAAPLRGRPSRRYLRYLRVVERLLGLSPSHVARRAILNRLLLPPRFARDVTLIADLGPPAPNVR